MPKIPDKILSDSMAIGLQIIEEKHNTKRGCKSRETHKIIAEKQCRKSAEQKPGKRRNERHEERSWTDSIMKYYGKDNDREDEALCTSTVKKDAFKELYASANPSSVVDKKDIKALEKAWEDLDGIGAVKANGKGRWTVKGLNSSLKHYQVLGVAFLRRREKSSTQPRGGLHADIMGLGSK